MPRLLYAAALPATAVVAAFGLAASGVLPSRAAFAPAVPVAHVTPAPQPVQPPPAPSLPAADRAGAANPAVEPGKVKWHPSFAAANEASARTGKPVLLFHMMGRLDRQFC